MYEGMRLLKRSWPAVSHSWIFWNKILGKERKEKKEKERKRLKTWSLTVLSSRYMVFDRKSIPMVAWKERGRSTRQPRRRRRRKTNMSKEMKKERKPDLVSAIKGVIHESGNQWSLSNCPCERGVERKKLKEGPEKVFFFNYANVPTATSHPFVSFWQKRILQFCGSVVQAEQMINLQVIFSMNWIEMKWKRN